MPVRQRAHNSVRLGGQKRRALSSTHSPLAPGLGRALELLSSTVRGLMQPSDELYLAESLREHRDHLETVLNELSKREREPLTYLESRLIIHQTVSRLVQVEGALRTDAEQRQGRGFAPHVRRLLPQRLRSLLMRIRGLTKPRIGSLRHYPPRPLLVPASYLEVEPPQQTPTISIVTPSFQQGRFLERTIGSVLGQQYPALEYVVQDGNSTDETTAVLRRFDGRLTHWASEPDSGQADAINRGFRHTTGEIMAWLNSDDLLLPGALAFVARYFDEHPEVDVVYGDRLMIDDDDSEIGAWILPRHDDVMLTLADYVPQETLFWRRRIWNAVGGSVDDGFHYAMDWELLLRFREAGARIVHVSRFLGAFRVHDEQKTTAEDAVGAEECAWLRRRVHGRDVPLSEVIVRIRPYLRRHVFVHTRYRLRTRLPLRLVVVETKTLEPTRESDPSDALPLGDGPAQPASQLPGAS